MYWRVRGRALAVALSEVSGACRGLSFVLEALWRSGRVYIYRHLRAELLQLARVVTRYVAVREVSCVSGHLCGVRARLALWQRERDVHPKKWRTLAARAPGC
jgi:hypothetical protein